MARAYVAGTGSYLPEKVLTNADVIARGVPATEEWIETKLGIRTRHIAAEDQQTSDLAVHAIRAALDDAGLQARDLDGLICSVGIGDVPLPATACYIQEKLGIKHGAFAFDVKMACAGSVGGMMIARGMIESGLAKRICITGTQVMSRTILDWKDRNVGPLFGDGAGAVILGPSPDRARGIVESRFHADGSHTGIIGQYIGGSREWLTPEAVRDGKIRLEMDGRAIWDVAVDLLPKVIHEVVDGAGLRVDDINFVVSHQANKRLLCHVMERAGVPLHKTHVNIERYGNTGPASSLIALDEVAKKGLVKAGDLVLFMAIGAGMMWGAHLIRW